MFELNQLEQLIMIAETGTISKAAKILHLSQPALSRSMQRLEAELQVPLFHRQKNKITFNENGKLAVEYARNLLNEAHSMSSHLQAYERSRHTLSIVSCAPAPLWELTPTISRIYSDMTIQSELKSSESLIFFGLKRDRYQIAITTKSIDNPEILSFPYIEEHLLIGLPPAHPLSSRKTLSLNDMNGQSVLILSSIGFWYDICREKMPDSMFIVQDELPMLNELRKTSEIPSFATDLSLKATTDDEHRIHVPLSDSEVNVRFYCNIKASNKAKLKHFVAFMETFH